MSCPICNHHELPEGSETCPKCGSDLEIFTHIENAHKENTFQKKAILVLTALFGIVLVSWGSVSYLSGNKQEASKALACAESTTVATTAPEAPAMADAGKPVAEFIKDNEIRPGADDPLNAVIETPAASTPEVSAPAAPAPEAKAPVTEKHAKTLKAKAVVEKEHSERGVIIHKVRKGDSYWTISKKYFNNGSHAKQIALDNNLNPKKSIPLGTKLKINK
jgi:nucleoid-associated protein YgaU